MYDTLFSLLPRQFCVGAQRLVQLVADGKNGIEACHRLLKHKPDLAAAHLPQLVGGQPHKLPPVKNNAAHCHSRRAGQPDHRQACYRLAGT